MEIRVENICKAYNGRPVLDGMNAVFEEGKIYCLMGPSGRGKTTLLRLLMGLEMPDRGEIYVGGVPLGFKETMKKYGMGRCRRKDQVPVEISAVFQEDRLCEALDAVQNVSMVPMEVFGKPRTDYVREQLHCVLPEESLEKPVRSLSGGMRRRVAIVRAVAAKSRLLLMDEPFTGLDEGTKAEVMRYLLKEQRGRTMIVVTHQESDAAALGAEIVALPEITPG